MKVREPVARPLDVVAVELLLSASQAFVAGVMMYLAVGIWDDRGVSVGPVAIILGMLGLAVGSAWLYWLMGGMGWPLAAANVPTAMFLGFALILGWQGDDFIRLDALPLVFAFAGSILGVIGGVFIDSPRRWRWDQRQKLRPGTEVPKISATTKAAMARLPRSMPTRSAALPAADVAAATATHADDTSDVTSPRGDVSEAYVAGASEGAVDADDRLAGGESDGDPDPGASSDAAAGSDGTRSAISASQSIEPIDGDAHEPARSSTTATPDADTGADTETPTEAIELPTSVEPKAQRSPWAWAAPPEWNRDDDDDDVPSGGSGNRT